MIVDRRQEPRLKLVTQRFDIFQNQRPAPRFFQSGLRLPLLHRPKQTATESFLLKGGTTDQRELLGRARAHCMQRMGNKRFACARLTIDQHVSVCLTEIEDILLQPLHRRRLPDQLLNQRTAIRQLLAQRTVIERQTSGCCGFLGKLRHAVRVERLLQEIESSDAHRLNRHRHITMTSDHDNRQLAINALKTLQELHPVHAGHLDVADDNPREIIANAFQRVFGRSKRLRLEARQR